MCVHHKAAEEQCKKKLFGNDFHDNSLLRFIYWNIRLYIFQVDITLQLSVTKLPQRHGWHQDAFNERAVARPPFVTIIAGF